MAARAPLFSATPVPQPERRKAVLATQKRLGKAVPEDAARRFLNLTILPPSKRWTFLSLGKSASSSTLHLLYQIEYGHPLTTHFIPTDDINPAAVIHQAAGAGVFGRALELGLGLDDLLQLRSERFVVVRNPYTRLASAFRYICRSNELGASWFLAPRLRAEAITGLDWTTMANSAEGFRRFLAYIEAEIATEGPHSLNPHWCIQAVSGFPGPYNPTLTGRVEALGAFFTEVARRLGAPMPEGHFHANRQVHDDDLAQDPPARRLIERIYADDFETFGY